MRILLTGAGGFVGSRLVQALLEEGHQLVCAVRHPPASGHPRVSYVQADFTRDTDKRAWAERLAGIDVVINCVGILREEGRQTFERIHTAAPCALFAACVEADVHLVIQLSALGADAGASTPYHLSKKAADDYLAGLPIASYIVQPSLIYGADGRSARAFKMLATLPFTVRFGRAEQRVQPVHVDDVVAVMVALTRRPVLGAAAARAQPRSFARLIPVVGPEPLPFSSYLRELRAALGLGGFRTLTLPGWLARAAATAGGWFPGSLLNRDTLAMLDRDNTADPALTTTLIGHPPTAVGQFVSNAAAERARAQLDWLLPLLRWSIALVWIATAVVSAFVYPAPDSYELLARTGIPEALRPLMLYGAAALDFVLGLGILLLRRRRWLWLTQLLLIGFYTVVIALRLPEFLVHPYGPLLKNLPLLAAIWLLYQTEDR
ncbi:MAG TPA: SDR family oxidoreductase [Telluria sp.]|nr:SDR family oxidoreductase [Telluria sp.]